MWWWSSFSAPTYEKEWIWRKYLFVWDTTMYLEKIFNLSMSYTNSDLVCCMSEYMTHFSLLPESREMRSLPLFGKIGLLWGNNISWSFWNLDCIIFKCLFPYHPTIFVLMRASTLFFKEPLLFLQRIFKTWYLKTHAHKRK